MAAVIKPGWSKPSTILFASEIPAKKKAFDFALAQAVEFSAELILFHAYNTLGVAASETTGARFYDYAAAARSEMQLLEPLAKHVQDAGVPCKMVFRPGLAADQIITFLREREIDRIVMGTHSPGPIGKMLVGGGRSRIAHRQSAGLHRGARRGRWRLPQLCHPHDSVRRQPAGD
jgi:nucleotide-binding universal stress UspA family protein